ncbi:MAG: hypothetical protein K940chlam7_00799 [Chlamydiae bacterium]|nr:hypothetical protein [Chlamydiota bacterium]
MKKIFLFILGAVIVTQTALSGTELMPWTERDLELYPRLDYLFQHYNSVHTSSGSRHHSSDDHFGTVGLSASYGSWSAELEAIFANTRHRSFGFDNFKVTGRYQWFNDVVGDFVSITTGITLIKASSVALDDLSSFHHGRNEAELHVSVGKEISCLDYWASRGWGVIAVGVADHGSPWLRGQLAWEKNFQRTTHLRLFVNALYGLGGDSLSIKSFDGYGSISHRSLDIGARISKTTDCWGIFRLEYAHRVYARYFPKCASLIQFSYLYPFGL